MHMCAHVCMCIRLVGGSFLLGTVMKYVPIMMYQLCCAPANCKQYTPSAWRSQSYEKYACYSFNVKVAVNVP